MGGNSCYKRGAYNELDKTIYIASVTILAV